MASVMVDMATNEDDDDGGTDTELDGGKICGGTEGGRSKFPVC